MRAKPYNADARVATGDGGSKIRLTRRLPQRGHIIRSRKPDSGMLRPRVQTNVSRLSSARWWHFAFERVYSTAPSRHRAWTRQPAVKASPRVSTCMRTDSEQLVAL